MKSIFLIICFVSTSSALFCQDATLILMADANSVALVDGDSVALLAPHEVIKINVSPGQHIIQAKSNTDAKTELINIDQSQQQVITFAFKDDNPKDDLEDITEESTSSESSKGAIPVDQFVVDIPGTIEVGIWMSENPDEFYQYPAFLYAFDKGDEVLLDLKMNNKKGKNYLEVSSYPDGKVVYEANAWQSLEDISFSISQKGIYKFTFSTLHGFTRTCDIEIGRVPGQKSDPNFSTDLLKKTIVDTLYDRQPEYAYEAVSIQEPVSYWVNSTTNIGGKSVITQPVILPENTVEWFYIIGADRDQAASHSNRNRFQLLGELSSLLLGHPALQIGANLLSTPPGSDYVDVYLLDRENHDLYFAGTQFRHFTEGSRKNIQAGKAKITCCNTGDYYLTINNDHLTAGVSVSLEVVAIVYRPTGRYVQVPTHTVSRTIFEMVTP